MSFAAPMRRLDGKVALVTGAANGIGEAIALRFAEEGARLVLADLQAEALRDVADHLRTEGAEIRESVGDMTREEAANAAVTSALEGFGRIDVLVNNVGGNTGGRIWDMAPEEWDRILTLNLRATFLCTRAAAPHMIAQRYGRIVCTSSGAREGAPWLALYAGAAAYSTAKAGLHGFVRDMAYELGEHGVCINAVAAGAIRTTRNAAYFARLDETIPESPQRITPLRRLGEPREIANAALFLASDEASYVTGTTLTANGGR
ncbi:SDR family NAD(P)-dependent oxidoreductase [uncultured Enterovirga sp.]|uniref:SDR family NAD(P)-dependent oxidoreductase n=1 Tax=uncultured Enterovirga sp. TaxID=2026352 RepID=UPI0035CBB165